MSFCRKQFKDIDLTAPFFDSLKADYAEFSSWFRKKSEDSAYVFETDEGRIDGFLYLKIEDGPVCDVTPAFPESRRLKIGTFKINAHGTRLGERFVKKIFDHAVSEGVKEIYLTIFAHHSGLIGLLKRYGFSAVGEKTTKNGTELVLLKKVQVLSNDVVLDYPIVRLKNQRAYLLSLRPEWHTRLLPDSILKTEDADIVQDISHTNSIHKVYLTAMRGTAALKSGDVLLIYRTSDGMAPAHHRSVATSICVVEEVRSIFSFATKDEFLEYCRPYSIFSDTELSIFWRQKKYPNIIRFTYNIALKKRLTRGAMIEEVGLDGGRNTYWGFLPLTHKQLIDIAHRGKIDESLIVH